MRRFPKSAKPYIRFCAESGAARIPKLSKKLPSYCKHKASGQAIVNIGGKDHYLGPYGTLASHREYDRLIGEYLTAGKTASGGAESLTVVELLAAFYRHAQQHYGKDRKETLNYRTLIKRLRLAYGDTPVNEFGPLRLKAFRQILVKAGLSRTSVNHTINRVRRVFKWGVENELVRGDVLEALRAVAGLGYPGLFTCIVEGASGREVLALGGWVGVGEAIRPPFSQSARG